MDQKGIKKSIMKDISCPIQCHANIVVRQSYEALSGAPDENIMDFVRQNFTILHIILRHLKTADHLMKSSPFCAR